MATADEKVAEMLRDVRAGNEKWKEQKAALLAWGNKPIFVSKEMRDRIEAAERQNPELFARVRRSLSN
jgi:hypothetical protein